MNALGKIFIGIIFLMSFLFMGFSIVVYSTHQTWKTKHDEIGKELSNVKAQLADLKKQNEDLDTFKKTKLNEKWSGIASLESTVIRLREDEAKSNADKAEMGNKIAAMMSTIASSHENIRNAQTEQNALRENFNKTQRDWNNLLDDYVAKTDEAHDLQMKLNNLEEVGRDLVKQYNSASTVLKHFGLKPLPEIYSGVPLHRVDGRVADVRPSDNTIEITIGEDSGIMKGHQLDIYRRADGRDVYIGVAEVVLAEPNRAACKILPQYRKGTVQVNDIVTSEYSQDRQKYQVKGGQEHVATKDR